MYHSVYIVGFNQHQYHLGGEEKNDQDKRDRFHKKLVAYD